jgi:antitoxin FitA
MASITIRNLDDETKRRLRVRAAEKGHSMEEEARLALAESVGLRMAGDNKDRSASGTKSWVKRFVGRFQEIGGVELELPPPQPARLPPDFSDFEPDADER